MFFCGLQVLCVENHIDVVLGHEPQIHHAWPKVCDFNQNEMLAIYSQFTTLNLH